MKYFYELMLRVNRKTIKALDAFPKVSEDYQKPTSYGGFFSVVSITLVALMVVVEVISYNEHDITYHYSVDTDMTARLKLFVDVTVAMPCEYLGADVIDSAGESRMLKEDFQKDPATFGLTPSQEQWLRTKQETLGGLRGYRLIDDLPTLGPRGGDSEMPHPQPHEEVPVSERTSCRIHGFVDLNKVAGNFHITAGQAVPHPQGHAHLNAFVPSNAVNFSHRIDKFWFGPTTAGIINPLEGSLVYANNSQHLYQYYIQLVPTRMEVSGRDFDTYQYSVTERNRSINHRAGSHGLPGVFFKYDLYSFMVTITEESKSLVIVLIRLCAITGGVFVTIGMATQFIGYALSLFRKKQSDTS